MENAKFKFQELNVWCLSERIPLEDCPSVGSHCSIGFLGFLTAAFISCVQKEFAVNAGGLNYAFIWVT